MTGWEQSWEHKSIILVYIFMHMYVSGYHVFNNSFNSIRPQRFYWTIINNFLLVFEYYFYCKKNHCSLYSTLGRHIPTQHPRLQHRASFFLPHWLTIGRNIPRNRMKSLMNYIFFFFFFFLTSSETFSCWPTLCCTYCTKYSIEKQERAEKICIKVGIPSRGYCEEGNVG